MIAVIILLMMTLLLQLPHTTDALSSTPIVTSGVESTARKRIGKKSFINKQSINKLPTIYTPEELHNLGISFSKRQVGSKSYYRGWFNWKTAAIDSIRNELSINNLPYPANRTKFENLFFRLGVASDVGEMPSFQDPGARSGYAIEFFCRGRNLADLFIDGFNQSYNFPSFWLDELRQSPMMGGDRSNADGEAKQQPYHIASVGGGPAFDYVGAALATQHCSYMSSTEQQQQITPEIKATILDYEEGWGDLVEAMANSTQYILQNSNLQCDWGGKCDITQSLHHPNNIATLAIAKTTDMFVCQYCVAENMKQLQESNYIFFHELFKYAKDNSLFVLSEVHPRLWPDFYHLIKDHCPYMQLGFNKNGRQMLLRKRTTIDCDKEQEEEASSSVMISDKDLKLVKKYEELAFYHSRKIDSGWVRQASKRRLS